VNCTLRREKLAIIVVDDSKFSCEVTKSNLLKTGFTDIRLANSAHTAIGMLNQRQADIILTDLNMPGMNGLELTDIIRRRDEIAHHYTSIILISATADSPLIVKAFELGIDDFMTKKADPDEIAARVYCAGRIANTQNDLLETVDQITTAMRNKDKYSLSDPITGLGNNKYLLDHLEGLMQHAATRGGGIGLALIDVNFGLDPSLQPKVASENLLQALSQSIKKSVRPADIVARLNDNRFAIAMHYASGANPDNSVFERVLNNIYLVTSEVTGIGDAINTSIGVFSKNRLEPNNAVDDFMKAAQEKLDTAVEDGGNRVIYH